MKIGILTYHYSYNFGAMIQAYALRKAILEYVGVDDLVELINYMPSTFVNSDENISNEKYIAKRDGRSKFLQEHCGVIGEPCSDIKHFDKYDIYITGSDQVWNPNLPVFEKTSEYFLDFVEAGKIRASYAASIGLKITDDISTELFEKNIPKFDYLSVREQSYCEFIERFTTKKCEAVLDPTFLISIENYIKLMPLKTKKNKYTLCVAYTLKAKSKLYDLVNRYTIVKHQDVVNMEHDIKPYYFMNQEESIYYCSIEEILWYIFNAEMVVTDSFHFVVFSILFHKPFYVMLTGKTSRITDLLDYLELSDRILKDNTTLDDMNNNIDYLKVDQKINAKRTKSIEYLKKVLGK